MDLDSYNSVRSGGGGFVAMPRGLIAVWGTEAVQFLDGMITNDMKTLEDGGQMLAAFPNAQGRLLALVRVLRQGDRFLIETEEATREAVFNNLFKFTFAGDFFVEDLSDKFRFFEIFGEVAKNHEDQEGLVFSTGRNPGIFVPASAADDFRSELNEKNVVEISGELYETLRVESGIPKYGVDMDETTIVPEIGLDGLISYTKGCYIGQEIIARIHFRGHVAKQLTGLYLPEISVLEGESLSGEELTTADGKNAGKITSAAFSPTLESFIALAYVRYHNLAEGTEVYINGKKAIVKNLPFAGTFV
ncbi:MAG TPA: glycine cleavage T C-terminal barrel domain-containing protein [Pyrinomonadaceae bacterium]|nr:glycine cleavage T C-terminal barrel domain-containing protein [Pyrinomonadaceae bacterium]HMP66181.1 glycine cleavage T C-terminal barrel domain-containing protein [Pyrinomonadaceae bacterium]